MINNENLVKWVKYNYSILNELPLNSESTVEFNKVKNELKKLGIEAIFISEIQKESYTISYTQSHIQKEATIYISEL